MYKLLIVEDEPAVREGIESTINWEAINIAFAGTCADGQEAWEFIQQDCPDLILTDIRMPQLSGLELVHKINEANLDVIIILLSGHDDFSYAKKAIQLGVFDYILKPCQPKQIREVIERAANELTQRRSKTLHFNELERQSKESRKTIAENRLLKLLRTPPRSPESRSSEIEESGLRLLDEPCLVIVLEIDTKALNRLSYHEGDLPLIRYAASNIMEESLQKHVSNYFEMATQNEQFIIVTNLSEQLGDFEELKTFLTELQTNISTFLKVTVSVGAGSIVSLSEIHRSYQEASEALTQRFFYGGGEIFVYGEEKMQHLAPEASPAFHEQLADFQKKMSQHIAMCNFSDFIIGVEEWLNEFKEQHLSIKRIHLHTYSLIDMLIKEVQMGNGQFADEQIELLETFAEHIENQETFEELSTLLTLMIQKMVELINAQKPLHKTTQHVCEIIKEKYMTNLTLKGIAEKVFISPSHLSTLFRQEMGINFLDYLHQFRIEKAKQLLREENGKVYLIATQVGYYDKAHFVRMFKKWTGVLPSQYQKKGEF